MVTETSFPVKVPGPLYAKLKEEAEREGITIQEALVRLITEPMAVLGGMRAQMARMEQRQTEMEGKLTDLEERLKKATERLTTLEGRVSHHEHPNYASKGEIVPLSETINEQGQKITTLTADMASFKDKTTQIEQAIARLQKDTSQLAEKHDKFVETFNSWVPFWKKIPTLESNDSALRSQLNGMERRLDYRDNVFLENLEDLNTRVQKLQKTVKALKEVAHTHVGQNLGGEP